MKAAIKFIFPILFSSFVFAQETICFKKDFTDIQNIDSVKLDGGLCSGTNSQTDMKDKGWGIKTVEIKDDYYLFVFKKESTPTNVSKLKSEIIKEIDDKKEEDIKNKKEKSNLEKYTEGKKLYLKKCASCHGDKGEKKTGYSRIIKDMNKDQFNSTIIGYKRGSYNLGDAREMKPYSLAISSKDIDNIYEYLQKVD